MKKFVLVLMIFCCFSERINVNAVENKGVFMSPPFVEITINKDDKQKEFFLEVGNNGENVMSLNLNVVDFGSLDESGGVAFLSSKKDSGDRKYTLASWLSLEKDWVTLAPNKKERVRITLLNRESLTSGGHYGAIMATVENEDKDGKQLLGLNQSLATLVYVQKTGGEIKNLVLNKVDFVNRWLDVPKKINTRFENKGNTHLVPRGKIEVYSPTATVVARGIINDSSGKIYPESFRVFETKVKNTSRVFLPGWYGVKVSYRYDSKEIFEEYITSFFYFGKEGVVLATTLILGVGFFVAWKRTV